jgi:hypothetical protein
MRSIRMPPSTSLPRNGLGHNAPGAREPMLGFAWVVLLTVLRIAPSGRVFSRAAFPRSRPRAGAGMAGPALQRAGPCLQLGFRTGESRSFRSCFGSPASPSLVRIVEFAIVGFESAAERLRPPDRSCIGLLPEHLRESPWLSRRLCHSGDDLDGTHSRRGVSIQRNDCSRENT